MKFLSQIKPVGVIALVFSIMLPIANGASLNLSNGPLYVGASVPPLVMLNLSKDHQLYYKAYNDFSDLDADGAIETTYKHSVNYYGYFDSYKCYDYSTTNSRFEPRVVTGDKYCDAVGGGWSGNFLNWISMSRMDAVRKLLYGGMRSTDTSSLTVLERAYLPMDAHSWTKYYNGSDVSKLTPFSPTTTNPTGTSGDNINLATNNALTFNTTLSGIKVGDQLKLTVSTDSTKFMIGGVTAVPGGQATIKIETGGVSGAGNSSSWTVTNLSRTGVTFCNTTRGATSGANQYSHTNTNPPVIRVAMGNYMLWAANERYQCYWSEEKNDLQNGFAGGFLSNGNRAALSGLGASAENPSSSATSSGEYIARVTACVTGLIGQERCSQYPGGNYKPVGLLQTYGDSGLLLFGLMTGSYEKNISGGVLRKNISDMTNEVNVSTDGTFKAVPASGGIVNTLNKLRLYGYNYNDGTYIGSDGCNYQHTGIAVSGGSSNGGYPAREGSCSTWGNPISEIFLESLRYLAGKTATTSFAANDTSKITGLTTATWTDPLTTSNYCAPLNVINFNASISSYDNDQMGGISDIGASSAVALTNTIGNYEGITNNNFFIGESSTDTNKLCSPKTVSALGEVTGICPEAPSQKGSYLMAGVAYHAHTNSIRTNLPRAIQKVSTYSVALATNVPRITIPIAGSATGQVVTIQPAYRLDRTDISSGNYGTGSLVDFKIVAQTATSGTFYVNWEDSNQGGDYDQDMWGIISYTVSGDTITVTTDAISASTVNPQGFGYIISGTAKDGAHFHSGIYSFDFTDPTGVTGCTNCDVSDGPTAVVYTIGAGSASSLKDPLYYAAKWGGFNDVNSNGLITSVSQWDNKRADGSGGSDGIPDNYFNVTNPGALEDSLNQAFTLILNSSSASAVATSSTSLNRGGYVYQAVFTNNDWSGGLKAYQLTYGTLDSTMAWNAADLLANPDPTSRVVLTYKPSIGDGVAFAWANLDSAEQTLLNKNISNFTDGLGSARVTYLRGSAADEGAGNYFRKRPNTKLGDIVNSTPRYVGVPSAGYLDSTYTAFYNANLNRVPMLYVGANDGMLHGFDGTSGQEKIAYIPNKVYRNLSKLTSSSYSHRYFVDGSPYSADVYFGGAWRTILVGGLNGGGQGIYALDVTNPSAFSEASAASTVLWEFTDSNNSATSAIDGDSDLGYTYSVPVIGKMANGKWVAIFGNGYNNTESDGSISSNGYAVLYIVDIQNGNLIKKISTQTGSTTTPNGLATPAAVDVNGDDVVDYIYAGDLEGNLWKFDVTNSNESQWKVAFGGGSPNPLFTARDASGNRQPITSAPEVGIHPNNGYLVYFGTGKYLENADATATTAQTFYAVWDKNDGTTVSARSDLKARTVTLSGSSRIPSSSSFTWRITGASSPNYLGWYFDFPETGERHVGTPQLFSGTVFFNTFTPTNVACDAGGTGWLMGFNAVSGGLQPFNIFDTNGDNTVSASDALSGGMKMAGSLGGTTIITGGSGNSGLGVTSTLAGGTGKTPLNLGAAASGRVSWRELINE